MKVFLNAFDPYFSRVDWIQVKFVYNWISFLRDQGKGYKKKRENVGSYFELFLRGACLPEGGTHSEDL